MNSKIDRMMSVLLESGYSEDNLSKARPRELFLFYLGCLPIPNSYAEELYDLAVELNKKEKVKDNNLFREPYNPYAAGYAAGKFFTGTVPIGYAAGIKEYFRENPYEAGTEEFEEWNKGYFHGCCNL